MARNNTKSGFTILDMMIYMAIMTVVTSLALTSFYYVNKQIKLQTGYLDDIENLLRCGELIKKDISESRGSMDTILSLTSGAPLLVLEKDVEMKTAYILEEDRIYRCLYKGKEIKSRSLVIDRVKKADFGLTIMREGVLVDFCIVLKERNRTMNTAPVMAFSEMTDWAGEGHE